MSKSKYHFLVCYEAMFCTATENNEELSKHNKYTEALTIVEKFLPSNQLKSNLL